MEEKTGLESLVHARLNPPPSFPIQTQAANLPTRDEDSNSYRPRAPAILYFFDAAAPIVSSCRLPRPRREIRGHVSSAQPPRFLQAFDAACHCQCPTATGHGQASASTALRIWWIKWHTQEKFLGQPGIADIRPSSISSITLHARPSTFKRTLSNHGQPESSITSF